MHLSGSRPDRASPLVADASFWINLFATGRSERLLEAIGGIPIITDVALNEIERGRSKGRSTAEAVNELVRNGIVKVTCCSAKDEQKFLSLVVGPASQTLDDGEAATLVCASSLGGIAIIDERKATSLAEVKFPELQVISTIGILLRPELMAEIGREIITEAIYNALVDARMRVSEKYLDNVMELLGAARASKCQSLPSRLRRA